MMAKRTVEDIQSGFGYILLYTAWLVLGAEQSYFM